MAFFDFSYGKGTYVKRMDPMDYNFNNESAVRSITFYMNGFYAGRLEGEELLQVLRPLTRINWKVSILCGIIPPTGRFRI